MAIDIGHRTRLLLLIELIERATHNNNASLTAAAGGEIALTALDMADKGLLTPDVIADLRESLHAAAFLGATRDEVHEELALVSASYL